MLTCTMQAQIHHGPHCTTTLGYVWPTALQISITNSLDNPFPHLQQPTQTEEKIPWQMDANDKDKKKGRGPENRGGGGGSMGGCGRGGAEERGVMDREGGSL